MQINRVWYQAQLDRIGPFDTWQAGELEDTARVLQKLALDMDPSLILLPFKEHLRAEGFSGVVVIRSTLLCVTNRFWLGPVSGYVDSEPLAYVTDWADRICYGQEIPAEIQTLAWGSALGELMSRELDRELLKRRQERSLKNG